MSRRSLQIFLALLVSVSAAGATAGIAQADTTFNTTVKISQKFPAFHGKLKSGSKFCIANRPVRLYRVRNGKPDKLLGHTKTGRTGQWKIRASLIAAAYYAVAPRFGSASLGIVCRSDRSHLVGAD